MRMNDFSPFLTNKMSNYLPNKPTCQEGMNTGRLLPATVNRMRGGLGNVTLDRFRY